MGERRELKRGRRKRCVSNDFEYMSRLYTNRKAVVLFDRGTSRAIAKASSVPLYRHSRYASVVKDLAIRMTWSSERWGHRPGCGTSDVLTPRGEHRCAPQSAPDWWHSTVQARNSLQEADGSKPHGREPERSAGHSPHAISTNVTGSAAIFVNRTHGEYRAVGQLASLGNLPQRKGTFIVRDCSPLTGQRRAVMRRVVQPLDHVGRTPKGAARSEPHYARETPGLLQCQGFWGRTIPDLR